MAIVVLVVFLGLFTLPVVAMLALVWCVTEDCREPEPLSREETNRAQKPQTCQNCHTGCFDKDWVCLCQCHDGRVPLHKLRHRLEAIRALGRLTGDDEP